MKTTYHDGSCSRTHLEESHDTMLNPHKESSLNIDSSSRWLFDWAQHYFHNKTLVKITAPDIQSRSNRVERVRKTEGLIDPRPEDGASGPPKFQPIRGEDEKTWELIPFPFLWA